VEQSRAWWQERSRVFLSECARLLAGRVGEETVEAVFLCGSFAVGDETVVLETKSPILLSDVDLVVVVRSLENLLVWSKRRAELGAACEKLWGDVQFSGRVDVGVMLPGDLERLPARPGVYDMRARGVVLGGDPGILERIPLYAPGDLTGREAVILIENRAIALIDSRAGARREGNAEPYAYLYRIARVYTDMAAAALAIAGSYVPGYAARRDLLRAKTGTEPDGVLAKLVRPDFLGRIERWTKFKLEPSLETAGLSSEPRSLEALWEEAARDLVNFLRQAATGLLERHRNIPTPREVEELLGGARDRYNWRNHLRSWRAFLSELPALRRAALAASLGGKIVSRYPLDVVRHEGIRLLDLRLANGPETFVRGATGGFPHHGGPWNSAAAELCENWKRLVFGRTV
jgi:predicted nucleotidyltransferase